MKLEILQLFFFCFALACEQIFIVTVRVDHLVGTDKVLFAGMCVHISAGTFYRLGQGRG